MSETFRKLGELCSIQAPLVDPAEEKHRNLPHVGAANIEPGTGRLLPVRSAAEDGQISPKFLFTNEDVLYSKIRPYLRKVATPDSMGLCSADVYPLRPRTEVIARDYLAAMLLSDEAAAYMASGSARSGIPKVNREHLFAWKVRLPPLAEQHRIIARVREALERVEEIEERRSEILEATRELVSSGLQDEFATLREQGVKEVALGELTVTSAYGTSRRAHPEAKGTPVLRMGNIVEGEIVEDDLKYVELPPAELKRQLLVEGDVLVNRTNSLELVGKAAPFDPSRGERVAASYLVRVRVDTRRVLPTWAAYCINGPSVRSYVLRTARRAIGMVNINSKEIARMPILLPPLDRQRSNVERLDALRVIAGQILAEHPADQVSSLRASILRQALASEL